MLNRKDVKKILTEKLQYKNGTIEKIEEDNLDDSYSHLVYRISWKGGMSFSVYLGPTYLWYYVERNGESLDQRGTGKLDDPVLSMMQNMICEIENGKYKNTIYFCTVHAYNNGKRVSTLRIYSNTNYNN